MSMGILLYARNRKKMKIINTDSGYSGITSCFRLIMTLLLFTASAELHAASFDIEISKSQQELRIIKDNEIIKRFHIAYGRGGKGYKRKMGDNKTPVGNYHIAEVKSDSKFYYFLQLDYPNLVDAWHGYKDRLISARVFKEIAMAYKNKQMPPQDTALGGYIGIHGIGDVTREKLSIHRRYNWTEGCIAVRNDEMNELLKYVSIGTHVIIKE